MAPLRGQHPELIRPFGRAERGTRLYFDTNTDGKIPEAEITFLFTIKQIAANLHKNTAPFLSLCFYIYRQTSLLINYARQPRVLSQLAGQLLELDLTSNLRKMRQAIFSLLPPHFQKSDPRTQSEFYRWCHQSVLEIVVERVLDLPFFNEPGTASFHFDLSWPHACVKTWKDSSSSPGAWNILYASGFFRGGGGTDLCERNDTVWFITIIELTPQIHHITGRFTI